MSTRRHPAKNARRASLAASLVATAGMTGLLALAETPATTAAATVTADTSTTTSDDSTRAVVPYDTSAGQVTTQSHGS
jgi:cytoskeletal protein RodZ